MTITGIIDWSDAAVADPAQVLGGVKAEGSRRAEEMSPWSFPLTDSGGRTEHAT